MVSPVQANLIAREKLTRALLAGLAEQAEVIDHGIPLTDCQKAATRVSNLFGFAEVAFLLQRFAVGSVKHLPKSVYPDFIRFCDNCVKWKCPPSASWSGDQPTYPEQWGEQL